MENGILFVVIGIIIAACGLGVGVALARRGSGSGGITLDEALAVVVSILGSRVGESEVRAVASWAYDRVGASSYYTRDEWIAFCLRSIPHVAEIAREAPDGLGT